MPEEHYKQYESISHSAAPNHDVRTRNHESSDTFIDGHNQERQQNYSCVQNSTDRSCIEEHYYQTATLDSSRYSDSPPIETQGYRILSQMNRLDAESGESSTYGNYYSQCLYLNKLIFLVFLEKNILCILKGISPFKMHKVIFFSRKPEKNSRFHQLI